MKTCQVQSRHDKTGNKQEECGSTAEYVVYRKKFGHYPKMKSYMCTYHAIFSIKVGKP